MRASCAVNNCNQSPNLRSTSTFFLKAAVTHLSSLIGETSKCAWETLTNCAPESSTNRVPHVVMSLLSISHCSVHRQPYFSSISHYLNVGWGLHNFLPMWHHPSIMIGNSIASADSVDVKLDRKAGGLVGPPAALSQLMLLTCHPNLSWMMMHTLNGWMGKDGTQ